MTRIERKVLAAVEVHLIVAPRLYARLPGLTKATVDATLASLQHAGRIVMHEHTNPLDPDRARLIHADGAVFVGACLRRPTKTPLAKASTPGVR